jgi:type II secretory pathway pseudopilin PulG
LLLIMLIGLGAAALLMQSVSGAGLEAVRQQRTLAALGQAREALIGYAAAHGRLPRPASSASAGTENPQPCASDAACSGLLPWVTLGITSVDGWGKLLHYSVTPAYTVAPLAAATAVADKRVHGRDSLGALTDVAGHQDCSVAAPCVPAVVFSSGKNNPAIDAHGYQQPGASDRNRDEQYNHTAANDFISRAVSDDPAVAGGDFDDMVSWIPLEVLYRRMTSAQVLQ